MNSKAKNVPEQKAGTKKTNRRGRIAAQPNPVDLHVGSCMRLRRTVLKMSQQEMAQKLGLTFQQIQKYEKGCNRIGASRLWDIARILNVPMNYFFEDMDEETKQQSPMCLIAPEAAGQLPDPKTGDDPMLRHETLELVRAYYKIANRSLAYAVLDMIKKMSACNSSLAKDNSPEKIHKQVNNMLRKKKK